MSSSDMKKAGFAGVLLIAAVVIYITMRPTSEEAPDTDDTKTYWYCPSCAAAFELTAAEMAASVELRAADSSGGAAAEGQPQIRGRGAQSQVRVAKCPKCQQMTGEAANKCMECGEVFAARAKSGKPAICPKCQWDPLTGRKAEGDRLYAND